MSYENFAYYYDSLMDEQFYDDYYQFINTHASFNSVLELGCGTGEIAIRLAKDNKEILDLLGINDGNQIVSCLVIGDPDVKYNSTVPRKKANINWL